MGFAAKIRSFDWVLLFATVCLAVFGILELVGMAYNNPVFWTLAYKQMVALFLALLAMSAVAFVDYRFLKNNSYAVMFMYGGALALLVLVLVVGEEVRGAREWFQVGNFAFSPTELVKIVLVLLLAKYFSARHIESYRFFHFFVSLCYILVPAVLILFQPDFGSVVIIGALWLAMLFFTGISKRNLVLLIVAALIAGTVGWTSFLKEYQKDRIVTFLNPYHDPQGAGYNVIQALTAIGDGGVSGTGLGFGSQIHLGFLPEAHTDFIFASIGEEFGLVGLMILFTLLGVIFWRITRIALDAENNFARLFCVGMLLLLFIQVVINAGMNLGIMPVTGITFPFVSYGGSSLIALFVGIGMVQSMKVYR